MNTNQNRQLVTFRLGDERFGVDIASVREIVRLPRITHLPMSSSVLEGIVNFRGQVAPVLNLRARLGLEPQDQEYSSHERLLVVSVEGKTYALLVDAVDAVESIEAGEIEPLAGILSGDNEYVLGMIKRGDKMLLALDLPGALGLEKEHEAPPLALAMRPAVLAPAQETRPAPAFRSAA
jgi:purine-binding chemotaxis protein CheW